MKRIPNITINPAKGDEFIYGNCALLAIGSAFNLSLPIMSGVCKILKLKDYDNGITFNECKKLISFLSKNFNKTVCYIPNCTDIKYYQLITLLNKGNYIVMFYEHLSYFENGKVYDTYLYKNEEQTKWLRAIPTGWWTID